MTSSFGDDDAKRHTHARCNPRVRMDGKGAGAGTPEDGTQPKERRSLADLINRHTPEIVCRWMVRVQADLRPEVGPIQLRDAMPDYLDRLSTAMTIGTDTPREEGPARPVEGAAIWSDVAREHALTRVRLGFDIDELVHEFIVLRQVLLEVISENGAQLEFGEIKRLTDLVEAAIVVAVKSYVAARDYAARQKESEHVAFLIHELRSPLSAISFAARRLRGQTPLVRPDLWNIVDRNVERLQSLIDGVLQVERLQAGKAQPNFRQLDLGELLARPLATAELAAEAKGLSLRTEYDPGLLLQIDPDLVGAALSNVLDNAVKYTDSGTVRLTAEDAGDRVVFHVWDNCPGLSREELQVIFEPFERGQSGKPGSGIGLAIARQAVEAQGGAIGADSNAERGCHFWMSLPKMQYGAMR
jgi:signal transduction histidine kinase